ncbi:MAG: type II toxin-antitoxin system RelE/ParE family toxin [Bacteroidota bacterium]
MAIFRLRFHPGFITQLEAAITYYSEKSGSIGNRFKQATAKELALLKKNPLARSKRYDDIRFARIDKFPYAIHYSVDALNNEVLIHSLLNDHQDPDKNWGKRI